MPSLWRGISRTACAPAERHAGSMWTGLRGLPCRERRMGGWIGWRAILDDMARDCRWAGRNPSSCSREPTVHPIRPARRQRVSGEASVGCNDAYVSVRRP